MKDLIWIELVKDRKDQTGQGKLVGRALTEPYRGKICLGEDLSDRQLGEVVPAVIRKDNGRILFINVDFVTYVELPGGQVLKRLPESETEAPFASNLKEAKRRFEALAVKLEADTVKKIREDLRQQKAAHAARVKFLASLSTEGRELFEMLEEHDWYAMWSDDPETKHNGVRAYRRVCDDTRAFAREHASEAKKIWKKAAPPDFDLDLS